ncbi:MAG TPA: EAL domain-containing protein [Gemmatimonadales bacterium]
MTAAAARRSEADAIRDLCLREHQLQREERHAQAIGVRYVMIAVAALLPVVDLWTDILVVQWQFLILLPLVSGIANVVVDLLRRAGGTAAWHFWTMIVLDSLLLALACAGMGSLGYLVIPFYVTAVSAYALGIPFAAGLMLTLATLAHPASRAAGYAYQGMEIPWQLIGVETACLLGLGYLAMRGPMIFTRRVRRAREALAGLERGDFSVRLPARSLDDIGFLGLSFNSTAVSLGEMVEALHTHIDERQRIEAQLAHQAFHDPLTGLANRVRFRERVEHALQRAGRNCERVTVLFIDLDGFKRVNDSLGHAAGDHMLVQVTDRLLNATRGCDTVARLGGDEFAVLLENVRDTDDAVRVADRIINSLRSPLRLELAEVVVGASIGVARADAGGDVESVSARADALLRDADVAMYRAKAQGAGSYEIFAPHMHAVARERLALEAELRHAVESERLRLAYQPIVELRDGRVTGVEALARWDHPVRGQVTPDVFIPVAEESGLIIPLGRWVLREACRQAAGWLPIVGEGFTVSVNVSGRQLQHPTLVHDVKDALASSGLPASALVLEITETALVQDAPSVTRRLGELKELGVRIAIDDFGTGYSSLGYLQRLPVDVLKIDRTFITNVGGEGHDTALARTILALGDTLSLRCVAEGIEDAHQHAHLRELGCELGQGFLFSRPVSAEEVEGLLGGLRV